MARNVPSDWDQYYSDCSLCGQRYHASDGGCDCVQEECQCGGCWFERREDEIICTECNTGPWRMESETVTHLVARKKMPHIGVEAGETYARVVMIGYYPDGPVTRDIFSHKLPKEKENQNER